MLRVLYWFFYTVFALSINYSLGSLMKKTDCKSIFTVKLLYKIIIFRIHMGKYSQVVMVIVMTYS